MKKKPEIELTQNARVLLKDIRRAFPHVDISFTVWGPQVIGHVPEGVKISQNIQVNINEKKRHRDYPMSLITLRALHDACARPLLKKKTRCNP